LIEGIRCGRKNLPAEAPQIRRAKAMVDIKVADPIELDKFVF